MNFGTLTFLTGTPGSGKSYTMTRWIVQEFIPKFRGRLYTNIPIKPVEIAIYLEKHGYSYSDVLERLNVIPKNTELGWRDGDDPHNYFKPLINQKKLLHGMLIFDEVHEFVPEKEVAANKGICEKWRKLFATIRHHHVKIVAISQEPDSVNKDFKKRSDTYLTLVNRDYMPVPLIGGEYYELRQVLTKFFKRTFKCSSVLKNRNVGNKFERVGRPEHFMFEDKYFNFYDSFSDTDEEEHSSDELEEEHHRMSHFQIVRWYFGRNLQSFLLFLVLLWGGYEMAFNNGLPRLMKGLLSGMEKSLDEQEADKLGLTLEEYEEKKFREEVKKEITEELNKKITSVETNISDQISQVSETLKTQVNPIQPIKVNPLLSRRLVYISSDSQKAILDNKQVIYPQQKIGDYRVTKIDFASRSVEFEPYFLLSF